MFVAVLSGIALGCTLDLVHRVACGDGYVDPVAGEECDPGDPDSYARACLSAFDGGVADCDRSTCKVIVDAQQCAFCGDDRVNVHPEAADGESSDGSGSGTSDTGDTDDDIEECDTSDFQGQTCPGGFGQLACVGCKINRDGCLPYCGDGHTDPNEKCDPDIDDLGTTKLCAPGADGTPGVDSPFGQIRLYGSGTAVCGETCEWKQSNCSYCGNAVLEQGETPLDNFGIFIEPAELCDGVLVDDDAVITAYSAGCGDADAPTRPNVRCNSRCNGFVGAPADEPLCCVESGEICPGEGEEVGCCYAYLHPDDRVPCTPGNMFQPPVCKT
jgi:hypothetical protein